MPSVLRLLMPPFRAALLRAIRPGRRVVFAGMTTFGLAAQVLIFMAGVRTLSYFLGFQEIGLILCLRFFQAAWLLLFAILLFSSLVTAISTIYLTQDNEILVTAPVAFSSLFTARFCQVFFVAGWMVVLFSLPVFGAYGLVFHAPFFFWPVMGAAVVGVTAIAAALGCICAILLVRFFPARRTKDIVVYLSLLFGITLYLVLRFLRPEQLVRPETFGHFLDYLAAVSAKPVFWLPPAWSAGLLSGILLDHQMDFLLLALILLTPCVLVVLGEWAMEHFFSFGLTRAQESYEGIVRRKAAPYNGARPFFRLLTKEAKMFLRDSTEWSQLFMVAALMVVYLYNFTALPLDRVPFAESYLTAVIAFLNIGMVAFLAASLSLRFVFPSISSEAGGFDQLRAAPLPLSRLLAAKFVFYIVPFSSLSLVLLLVSNHFLAVAGPMWWISLGAGMLLTWTSVGLALGFGALYADFNLECRSAALGSVGAFVYLLVMGGITLTLLGTGGWPAYRLTKQWLIEGTMGGQEIFFVALWGGCALAGTVVCTSMLLAKGLSRLEKG